MAVTVVHLSRSTPSRVATRLTALLCACLWGAQAACGAAASDDSGPAWEASPCGAAYCPDLEALREFNPGNGRGAAFIDIDGDGWEDLWRASADGELGAVALLHNEAGHFVAWDIAPPPAARQFNWAGVWGDIDNDGDPDLVLLNGGYAGVGGIRLYRNDVPTGGGLTDITAWSGLSNEQRAWWGGSFADMDGDGYLDLAVTAVRRLDNSALGVIEVYRNLHGGNFARLPALAPLGTHGAKNPVWFDYDHDGDPDLFVPIQADDGSLAHDRLYRNDRTTLTDKSEMVPPDPAEPSPWDVASFHGTFSAAADDFDQDGRDDLYLGRWTHQDVILLNRPSGFVAVGREAGLDMSTDNYNEENTMGLGVGDFNGDGFPDVFVGTGEPHNAYPPLVYCSNTERLSLVRCSDPFMRGHGRSWHHGVAIGDIDHDGDADIFLSLGGHVHPPEDISALPGLDNRQQPVLYRQYSATEPQTVAVRLRGIRSNRDAVGAYLEIVADRNHYLTVHNTQGFQSLNSAWQVLRAAPEGPTTLNIRWPSGERLTVTVNRGDRVTVDEDGNITHDP